MKRWLGLSALVFAAACVRGGRCGAARGRSLPRAPRSARPTSASSASRSVARSCCRRSRARRGATCCRRRCANGARKSPPRACARSTSWCGKRASGAALRDAPSRANARAGAGRARRERPAGRDALGALQALAQGKAREPQGRRRDERAREMEPAIPDQRRHRAGHHLRGLRAWLACWCCSSSGRSCAPRACWAARAARAARASPAAQWRRRLMLADVAAAPLADRPGMLLRLLGEALTRAERLAGRRRPDGGRHRAPRAASIRTHERAELAQVADDGRARCVTAAVRRRDEQLEGTVTSRAKPCSRNSRASRQASADARTRHRIPAGAGGARGVLRSVAASGAVARSGRRCRATDHRRTARQWVCRPVRMAAAVPVSRCVPCASVTPALDRARRAVARQPADPLVARRGSVSQR